MARGVILQLANGEMYLFRDGLTGSAGVKLSDAERADWRTNGGDVYLSMAKLESVEALVERTMAQVVSVEFDEGGESGPVPQLSMATFSEN